MMKIECPHCNKKGIGYFSKWWSGSATPARCSQCENRSYVSNGSRYYSTPTAINISLITVGVLALLLTQNFYFLLLIPFGYLLSQLYIVFYSPLEKATAKEIGRNKRLGNIFISLLLGAIFLYYLVQIIVSN